MKEKKPDKRSRQERIDRLLAVTAEVFEKETSEGMFELYNALLSPFSIEEIESAFYTWLNSTDSDIYDFFPKPNQLIRIIKRASQGSIEARAQEQWRHVMNMVSVNGVNHPPKFEDPITAHLVRTQFHWYFLCSIAEMNLPFEQKRWCQAYDLAVELEADLRYIAAPERILRLVKPIGKIE